MKIDTIDRKTTNCLMFLVVLSFLFWYIPTSYFNIFACDDFWFGTNVHLKGFWANQSYYWHNWEGSYTHTFLASFPHIFHFPKVPFVCNVISLMALQSSLTFFIRTFSECGTTLAALRAAFLTSLVYTFTLGGAEIRFWVCANFTYVLETSCVIFFISVYHKLYINSKPIYYVLIFVLSTIIGGSKVTFIYLSICLLILHDICYRRLVNKDILFAEISLAIFTLVNILAPGNYIRLEEETSKNVSEFSMSMIETIYFRIIKIMPWFLISLLSVPSSFKYSTFNTNKEMTIMILCIFAILYYLGESVIMYICFNDPGPRRVYFQSEIIILLFTSGILGKIFQSTSTCPVFGKVSSLLASFIIISFNAYYASKVPGSIEYSKEAYYRDSIVKNAPKEGTVILPELPNSYLLLSYFANETTWLENVYLPYFGNNCKVELISTSE